MRVEEEEIDPVELRALDIGLRREVEHRLEIDERFCARAPFADEARPHRVVQRWTRAEKRLS